MKPKFQKVKKTTRKLTLPFTEAELLSDLDQYTAHADEMATLSSTRTKYALSELLAQCDPDASDPDDLSAWHATHPVGREF